MNKRMIDEYSVYAAEKRAGVYDDDECDYCGPSCYCEDEDYIYDSWRDRDFDEY